MQSAHASKLRRDYRTEVNSWPGVELLLGVFSTGGRAHDAFAGALRGWCSRAAKRRQCTTAVDSHALASGLCYRVAGILSVHLQALVHRLTADSFHQSPALSRAEAGDPCLWEAAVAAEAAAFPGPHSLG